MSAKGEIALISIARTGLREKENVERKAFHDARVTRPHSGSFFARFSMRGSQTSGMSPRHSAFNLYAHFMTPSRSSGDISAHSCSFLFVISLVACVTVLVANFAGEGSRCARCARGRLC